MRRVIFFLLVTFAALVATKAGAASFVDNGNGTVTDNKTGLVWQQGEPGYMTWDSALSYCEGLSLGGHSDWRLPNIKELESLTDDTRDNPAIDIAFFPNAHASYYWSSTTLADYPDGAWPVHFSDGYVFYYSTKYSSNYVRCVRGGQSGSLGNLKIGVFRIGAWYLDSNGNGAWNGCSTDFCRTFGLSTDTPIAGDWNGDGWTEIGVKRGTNWYLDYNGNGAWDGCVIDRCYTLGLSTDILVIGDWNNSGTDKIGVFRNGSWYLDYNGNGIWNGCLTDLCISFGLPTDIPVVGDWNGDGYAEIGVFRNGSWYLDYDRSDSWSGCGVDECYNFGLSTDIPVVGDWDGDGFTEIGVFRNGAWYLDKDGSGNWSGCSVDGCYTFGMTGDKPVSGNW
jgi:hypothetical protein